MICIIFNAELLFDLCAFCDYKSNISWRYHRLFKCWLLRAELTDNAVGEFFSDIIIIYSLVLVLVLSEMPNALVLYGLSLLCHFVNAKIFLAGINFFEEEVSPVR